MSQAKDETMPGAARGERGGTSGNKWRERRRFLLATITLTVMYLAIQEAWLWGATWLGRVGWTVNDPAQTYAEQAAQLADQSKAREAMLGPQHPRAVYRLGIRYGYLSQWLGGYGSQPEETMRLLARPVERTLQDMQTQAQFLGIGAVEPLPVRTAADFGQLTRRLEEDAGGVATRVEEATSPRLRELFMLGVHAGTELAALESQHDVLPIPASALIGMHGTLAAVPEPLWRPLTRLPQSDKTAALAYYRAAVDALDQSLAEGTSSTAPGRK